MMKQTLAASLTAATLLTASATSTYAFPVIERMEIAEVGRAGQRLSSQPFYAPKGYKIRHAWVRDSHGGVLKNGLEHKDGSLGDSDKLRIFPDGIGLQIVDVGYVTDRNGATKIKGERFYGGWFEVEMDLVPIN